MGPDGDGGSGPDFQNGSFDGDVIIFFGGNFHSNARDMCALLAFITAFWKAVAETCQYQLLEKGQETDEDPSAQDDQSEADSETTQATGKSKKINFKTKSLKIRKLTLKKSYDGKTLSTRMNRKARHTQQKLIPI